MICENENPRFDRAPRRHRYRNEHGAIKALVENVPGPDSITRFLLSVRNGIVAGSLLLCPLAWPGNDALASEQARNQIECLAPGRAEPISLRMNDAELRYALRRGITSFIIHLAAPRQRRCFTLVNGNMAAAGKLSIATANERLAADNPRWRVVNGAVRFRHKRLFALSLLGVDAKFIKLTIQVDHLEKVAQEEEPDQRANRYTAQP